MILYRQLRGMQRKHVQHPKLQGAITGGVTQFRHSGFALIGRQRNVSHNDTQLSDERKLPLGVTGGSFGERGKGV